ncbi:MAG: ankyrin repeat domain-containing protein [Kiritimatiellaeota bacterium]|nr:ankyrin repeat domain-containing protein [Kiritimatiellota bacterium]
MNKRNLLCVGTVTVAVCFALVTGCKLPTSQPRQAFDSESAIERLRKIQADRFEFSEQFDDSSGDFAWERKRFLNYFSLLVRYRDTKKFEVDEDGCTLLMHAVKCGTVDEVKGLLSAGIDVNAKNERGETALLIASFAGTDAWTDADIFKILLSAGADVNVMDKSGHTALYWVAMAGNTDIVKMLLIAGANVNVVGDFGPILVAAVGHGRLETVQILLSAGTDVNAENESGHTALYYAAYGGDETLVAMLLSASADVNAKDNEDATALSLAKKPAAIALLREAGAKE